VRCTTGAGAGGGGGAVFVLEKEKQPEPSAAAARTNPRAKNFIIQVPQAKASLRMWQPYPATTTARSVHTFGLRFKPASIESRLLLWRNRSLLRPSLVSS
jgi:hypothetical protein